MNYLSTQISYNNLLCSCNRAELVPAYIRLLRDNEAEVRIAAAGKVTKFCKIVSVPLAIQSILPCVKVIQANL